MRVAPPLYYEERISIVMKKIVFVFICLFVCLLSFEGCKKNELQETKGVVTHIKIHKDSLMSARILVDGDTLVFDMQDARIVGAMFVNGDSVKLNYIEGNGDTLRAFVVSVIAKPIHEITPNVSVSDTIITAPAKQEE